MKYYIIPVVFMLLSACGDSDILSPSEKTAYKKLAYEFLSDDEKATITTEWQDAELLTGTYEKDGTDNKLEINSERTIYFFIFSGEVSPDNGDKLVAVTFNTTQDALLGPITLIIDVQSDSIIGFIPRL